VLGILEERAVAAPEARAGGERFCGAVVASVAGMSATRYQQPDPVITREHATAIDHRQFEATVGADAFPA
jgi:hypothetical protein